MLRTLLSVSALIAGGLTFFGGFAANLSGLSFHGISGDHVVGAGLLLLGTLFFLESARI
jgi:hypothetical protein